ncbi:MAG TPA: cupin [Elusimicrobia bacterium]|nr:cupin [Elusimicrobiota bacterium]
MKKKGTTVVKKPWGSETIFADTGLYLGKILTINKGSRLSLQYHTRKHETLYVQKGVCLMMISGRRRVCRPGAAVVIPPRTRHRFCAPYGRVQLVEVSTYHPNDTVRLEDDYGR